METKGSILIVDDDSIVLFSLQEVLASNGYRVFIAFGPSEAIKILESSPVNLLITDLKMTGGSGLDLVKHVRTNFPKIKIIMITGFASVNSAVEAVKTGVIEYLEKPFDSKSIIDKVNKVFEIVSLEKANKLPQQLNKYSKYGLIGNSDVMNDVYDKIERAANTNATILITGESGVGKDVIARTIHYTGNRATAPFVPVNCGSIPENLIESELFGHVKGAYTGAEFSRAGFFQTANGGTVFLDEISETSLSMQVKILRVLQEKEICMVGDNNYKKVDIRIIAATNKDLNPLIKKELFRKDLFFRLNVLTINVPGLRQRGDDILLLLNFFLNKYSFEMNKPVPEFSDDALMTMKNYSWPGNVRELENIVQRVLIESENKIISRSDLPFHNKNESTFNIGLDRSINEVVKEYILNVLAKNDGNKSQAAKILGISRKTLIEKIKDHSKINNNFDQNLDE